MISVHSSGQPSTKMIACESSRNCSGERFMQFHQSMMEDFKRQVMVAQTMQPK